MDEFIIINYNFHYMDFSRNKINKIGVPKKLYHIILGDDSTQSKGNPKEMSRIMQKKDNFKDNREPKVKRCLGIC